jgi:hypothetical protein
MTTKEDFPTIKVVNVQNNQQVTQLTVWAEVETPEQRMNSYLMCRTKWNLVSIKDYDDGKTTITHILYVEPKEKGVITPEQRSKIQSIKTKYRRSEVNVSEVWNTKTHKTSIFVEVILADFSRKYFQF